VSALGVRLHDVFVRLFPHCCGGLLQDRILICCAKLHLHHHGPFVEKAFQLEAIGCARRRRGKGCLPVGQNRSACAHFSSFCPNVWTKRRRHSVRICSTRSPREETESSLVRLTPFDIMGELPSFCGGKTKTDSFVCFWAFQDV
jgi:hypothetical protein